jgi:hypothetical protein
VNRAADEGQEPADDPAAEVPQASTAAESAVNAKAEELCEPLHTHSVGWHPSSADDETSVWRRTPEKPGHPKREISELTNAIGQALGVLVLLLIAVVIWFFLPVNFQDSTLEILRRVLWILQRVGEIVMDILSAIWETSATDSIPRTETQ